MSSSNQLYPTRPNISCPNRIQNPVSTAILKCHDSPSPTKNPKADPISGRFIFPITRRELISERIQNRLSAELIAQPFVRLHSVSLCFSVATNSAGAFYSGNNLARHDLAFWAKHIVAQPTKETITLELLYKYEPLSPCPWQFSIPTPQKFPAASFFLPASRQQQPPASCPLHRAPLHGEQQAGAPAPSSSALKLLPGVHGAGVSPAPPLLLVPRAAATRRKQGQQPWRFPLRAPLSPMAGPMLPALGIPAAASSIFSPTVSSLCSCMCAGIFHGRELPLVAISPARPLQASSNSMAAQLLPHGAAPAASPPCALSPWRAAPCSELFPLTCSRLTPWSRAPSLQQPLHLSPFRHYGAQPRLFPSTQQIGQLLCSSIHRRQIFLGLNSTRCPSVLPRCAPARCAVPSRFCSHRWCTRSAALHCCMSRCARARRSAKCLGGVLRSEPHAVVPIGCLLLLRSPAVVVIHSGETTTILVRSRIDIVLL
jgi:hypothetical protein